MTTDRSGYGAPANDTLSGEVRFHQLYADGPSRAAKNGSPLLRPFRRLAVRLTHGIRDHQREIDLALLESVHQAIAETAQTRAIAMAARAEVVTAAEASIQAAAEAATNRDQIGSLVDTAARFQRSTEDVEARLAVAVALNDELSLAVDALHSEVESSRSDAMAASGRLQQIDEALHESSCRLTEELASATRMLAKEIADVRDELLRQRVMTEKMGFIYQDLTSAPFMTEAHDLRLKDAQGRQVMGFEAPWDSREMYAGFEEVFRGEESMIRDRQRGYVEILRDAAPVVELGPGRGEMLELLAEAGVSAVGIDFDPVMTGRIRAKGLAVECGDALQYLDAQPDGSIGAIYSSQFVEHLVGDQVIALIQMAHEKLVPGGLFVAETINPHSPRALKAFWVDLTHAHPIFPESLVVWCGLAGFSQASVRFPLGTGDLDADLLTQGEYAVVARTSTERT
jgi:SAM-dependent methyltransferase